MHYRFREPWEMNKIEWGTRGFKRLIFKYIVFFESRISRGSWECGRGSMGISYNELEDVVIEEIFQREMG